MVCLFLTLPDFWFRGKKLSLKYSGYNNHTVIPVLVEEGVQGNFRCRFLGDTPKCFTYLHYSSQTIKILGSWTASSGICFPKKLCIYSAAKISSDAFSLWILIAVTWFMYSVFFMHVSYLFTSRYFNFCNYFNKNYS